MKLTKIEKLISEIIKQHPEQQLLEATIKQAKVQKPLNDLMSCLRNSKKYLGTDFAKKAVSELLQAAGGDATATDAAQKLLTAIINTESNLDKIIKWLNTEPSTPLTKDVWTHVGKRH